MDNLTSKIYLVVIGLFVTLAVSAQQITGVVKDTGGQPLTGVSVFVDGTTTGASTDIDRYEDTGSPYRQQPCL